LELQAAKKAGGKCIVVPYSLPRITCDFSEFIGDKIDKFKDV
jgi:hypothetical protein